MPLEEKNLTKPTSRITGYILQHTSENGGTNLYTVNDAGDGYVSIKDGGREAMLVTAVEWNDIDRCVRSLLAPEVTTVTTELAEEKLGESAP